MQNVTTKTRTRYLAAILAAILMCLMVVIGFSANTPKAANASTMMEDSPKVGISFPDSGKYNDYYVNYYVDHYQGKGYIAIPKRCSSVYSQILDIKSLAKDVKVLIINPIVAPKAMDPTTLSDFISALHYAKDEGAQIIIYCELNTTFPEGTTFIVGPGYFELGIRNAESTVNSWYTDENSTICIYYYDNDAGIEYMNGAKAVFDQYSFTNVEFIVVDSIQDAVTEAENRLLDLEYSEIAVIKTYDFDMAEAILQMYFDKGYVEDEFYFDTAIGVFPLEEDDEEMKNHFDSEAEIMDNTVDALMKDEVPPDAEIEGEFYVIQMEFFPGRMRYVQQ
ncbi:MAG: hypothetical protein K2L88_01145 [Clostridiales bacterium]|nr:hypothetical protein [Clostridiales bacterium]